MFDWSHHPHDNDDDRVWFKHIVCQLDDIKSELFVIRYAEREIMSDQETADADAAAIEADVASEKTSLQAIRDEIAALQNQNPAVDFTALNAAVADATGEAADEASVAPAPTPAPEPTPAS